MVYIKRLIRVPALYELLRVLAAVSVSAVIAVIIISFTSSAPALSVRQFFLAPIGSAFTIGKVLTAAVPLMFTGVAVCIMVRCGQFNMFVEGAFYSGSLIGAVIAVSISLPGVLQPLAAMFAAAAITGALGYVPAKLKARLGVNEFVSSLMYNFIIFWVCMYLFQHHLRDPDFAALATPLMGDDAKLPYLNLHNEISSSVLIALVVVGLAAVFLYRTRWGYMIRMTGGNSRFAEYCGIRTKSAVVYSQVIGAGLSGFGGAAFMLGNFWRFNWTSLPNYGFDGFIVAIIARNNPLMVPFAALFIGWLRTGAMEMARLSDVPNEVVFIIQAIMMILVSAQAFLSRVRKKGLAAAAGEEAGHA
jgi:simple sugar transport system permease protein